MCPEHLKGAVILAVDDDHVNLQVLLDHLISAGFKINVADDGKEAIEIAGLIKPDIILLDIMMPNMDGLEACRCLKSDPATRDIPIIFLTAKSDKKNILKGFRLGCADYITKPFNEDELLARIKTHLELSLYRKHLEKMVRERTDALRVLLETREEIIAENKEKITANIINRLLPIIETFREELITPKQNEYLTIIENEIGALLSEFGHKISSPGFNLTQTEIKIAGFIRDGKSARQIAVLLNVEENTVSFHRKNIRKKLGLLNLKTSLKTFLQNMALC